MNVKKILLILVLGFWIIYPLSIPFLQNFIAVSNIWWYVDLAVFSLLVGWAMQHLYSFPPKRKLTHPVFVLSIMSVSYATLFFLTTVLSQMGAVLQGLSSNVSSSDISGGLANMFGSGYLNSHIGFAIALFCAGGLIFLKTPDKDLESSVAYLIPVGVYILLCFVFHVLAARLLLSFF